MSRQLHHSFDDIELIRKLQNGDLEAFDLIYEKYSEKLYNFGLKYLRSPAESEELVQSVFLKIWENHKHLNKELSFKSYLFTIAYNDICKLFRKRSYQRRFVNEFLYTNSPSSSNTEDSLDYHSVLERLKKIVDKLPERQKDVFRRSKQEGKTTKEIAKELSLSPGTVDNYISAALGFIKRQLHKDDLALVLFASLFIF